MEVQPPGFGIRATFQGEGFEVKDPFFRKVVQMHLARFFFVK